MTKREYLSARVRLTELKELGPLKTGEAAEYMRLEEQIKEYERFSLTLEEEGLATKFDRILKEYKEALDEHGDCRPIPTGNPAGKIAKCAICQGGLGWWCPVSKDHLCEYGPDRDKCLYCLEPGNRSHLDLV